MREHTFTSSRRKLLGGVFQLTKATIASAVAAATTAAAPAIIIG